MMPNKVRDFYTSSSSTWLSLSNPTHSSCIVGEDAPAGAWSLGGGGGAHDDQKASNMYVCMQGRREGRKEVGHEGLPAGLWVRADIPLNTMTM